MLGALFTYQTCYAKALFTRLPHSSRRHFLFVRLLHGKTGKPEDQRSRGGRTSGANKKRSRPPSGHEPATRPDLFATHRFRTCPTHLAGRDAHNVLHEKRTKPGTL